MLIYQPQLQKLNHIGIYITTDTDASKSIVNSRVTSLLDYCNALLIGAQKTILNILENFQNTATRLVARTFLYDHITPILKQLNWLPVKYRTKYKFLTHKCKALHNKSLTCIKNCSKGTNRIKHLDLRKSVINGCTQKSNSCV